MLIDPPPIPSSWADICALAERLRAAARDSGHLTDWTAAMEAARSDTDTLVQWTHLCRDIARTASWQQHHGIRHDTAPSNSPIIYGCPRSRPCTRLEPSDRDGHPPLCLLADTRMLPVDS